MSDALNRATEQVLELLRNAGTGLSSEVLESIESGRDYVADRLDHLATLTGDPGFIDAAMAEADAVAIYLGIVATDAGDAADEKLRNILSGGLAIAASLLREI